MRLQSSIGYQTVYVQAPEGSFAGSPCPTGYMGTKIWDETGRYQVDVCYPYTPPAAPPPPPPAPVYYNTNTVSPQIQVSPQISPVFQQQFQPTNSPATAGTTQNTTTAAPNQPTVPDRPSYAPPPAYVAPPPPPRQIDYTTPAVVTNQPPPPANLPPPTGSANVAFEVQPTGSPPPLSTLLNNPNIANAADNAPAQTETAPATGKTKLIGIGLAAILLLAVLSSKKRKK
jgi:hypothetical protein